jgi:hypothetical protein
LIVLSYESPLSRLCKKPQISGHLKRMRKIFRLLAEGKNSNKNEKSSIDYCLCDSNVWDDCLRKGGRPIRKREWTLGIGEAGRG